MTSKDDTMSPYVGLPDPDLRIEDDVIVSAAFDDIYFHRERGFEESHYVFCEGTELAARLASSDHLTIAETGFGTGLNFLAATKLRDKVNPHCQLDYISFELCPLGADIITKAHQRYPEIAKSSEALCAALPPRWPGYHKVILDGGLTHLHLYYGTAKEQMAELSRQADIWFLDGFNPTTNPDLWQQDMMDEIWRLSAPAARLATFTSAGDVRRALVQAGFVVAKKKGFGTKREMLIAHKEGASPQHRPMPQSAIVIGGGIAGASLAYALYQRGVKATILEAGKSLASGASGNEVAMQSARLRVHNDAQGRLSVACLSYAKTLAEQANLIAHQGAVTTNVRARDQKRLDKLAKAGWPEALFQALSADEVAQLTGLPVTEAGDYQAASAVIYPAKLTAYLARFADCRLDCQVAKISPHEDGYELLLASGKTLTAPLVFVATGADLPSLLARSDLPDIDHQISAGQVSYWQAPTALSDVKVGVNYGGYMTPAIAGKQYFGASFNRDGQKDVTKEGHQHNIDLLPEAWRALAPDITKAQGRLSYRLSTKDRMPLCGAIGDNLYLLCGLGARGMTHGPLLGDMLVATALGKPAGLDEAVIDALLPHHSFKDSTR